MAGIINSKARQTTSTRKASLVETEGAGEYELFLERTTTAGLQSEWLTQNCQSLNLKNKNRNLDFYMKSTNF